MTITVKGVYHAGKIDLLEKADVAEGAEVLVTIQSSQPNGDRRIVRGMFASAGARDATLEDFREAKSIWEPKAGE